MSEAQYRVQLRHPLARVPVRATPGSAGFDVCACEAAVVPAYGGRATVDTGVAVAFDGVATEAYCRVAPRSGLAARHGVDVLAGVVDADYYPNAIKVILVNHGKEDLVIEPGMRIAQLIFERTCRVPVLEETVDIEAPAPSAHAGFGSTGL
jgi:deoxyuridine 5'-triphosphate nucleotidohydrolase